jgi:plasmid stabilization system protein ParE
MSDFVLTPAAQADVLRIIDFLEGDNPSAILLGRARQDSNLRHPT